jgi:peptidoglycan hydrolase CwlO-like protein
MGGKHERNRFAAKKILVRTGGTKEMNAIKSLTVDELLRADFTIIKNKDDVINALLLRIEDMHIESSCSIENLNNNILELDSYIDDLRDRLDEALNEVDELETKLNKSEENVSELMGDIESLHYEISELMDQVHE